MEQFLIVKSFSGMSNTAPKHPRSGTHSECEVIFGLGFSRAVELTLALAGALVGRSDVSNSGDLEFAKS